MVLAIETRPQFHRIKPPVRFGAEGTPPDKSTPGGEKGDRFESQAAQPGATTEAPQPTAPKTAWYTTGCFAWPARLVSKLWPLKSKPTEAGQPATVTQSPAATDAKGVEQAAEVKGTEKAAEVKAPDAITIPPLPENLNKPSKLGRALNLGLKIAINGFHIATAVILTIGLTTTMPFLHGHLAIALGAAASLHLLQDLLHRKFPNHTPSEEEMIQTGKEIHRKFNRGRARIGWFFRKTWGFKMLYKPYRKVSHWASGFFNRSMMAMMRLVHKTSLAKKMPNGFWDKLGYMAKSMTLLTISMIFPGTWWTRFFDMEDLEAISDAIQGVKRVPQPKDMTPPTVTDPSGEGKAPSGGSVTGVTPPAVTAQKPGSVDATGTAPLDPKGKTKP